MTKKPRGESAKVGGTETRRPVAVSGLVDEHRNLHPVFSFALTDWTYSGEWGWNLLDGKDALRLVGFLHELGKKTWNEILNETNYGRKKHHAHAVADLCQDAQGRLEALHHDESSIFRFRDGPTKRLWGFHAADDGVFYILWWDPSHKIYPTDP